ncbi:MAG: hypothetical protein R3F17_04185 [Planctomycetota bacterium]
MPAVHATAAYLVAILIGHPLAQFPGAWDHAALGLDHSKDLHSAPLG